MSPEEWAGRGENNPVSCVSGAVLTEHGDISQVTRDSHLLERGAEVGVKLIPFQTEVLLSWGRISSSRIRVVHALQAAQLCYKTRMISHWVRNTAYLTCCYLDTELLSKFSHHTDHTAHWQQSTISKEFTYDNHPNSNVNLLNIFYVMNLHWFTSWYIKIVKTNLNSNWAL